MEKTTIKQMAKIFIVSLSMAIIMATAINTKVSAKTKNSVKFVLKKGTLTVSGKGKMPKLKNVKKNKIKKVVIKNGVTTVRKENFYNCKNLKKVVIGDSVKTIENQAFYKCKKLSSVKFGKKVRKIGEEAFNSTALKKIILPTTVKSVGYAAFWNTKITTATVPGKMSIVGEEFDEEFITADTIKFNTNVSLNFVNYCFAKKFVVSKSDKKYQSINGAIYTKDSTMKLVKAPEVKELKVAEGCKEFKMNAILYSLYRGDDYYKMHCTGLEKIVLPKSLEKISSDGVDIEDIEYYNLKDVEIKTDKLDSKSIENFLAQFDTKSSEWNEAKVSKNVKKTYANSYIGIEQFAKQLPRKITNKNGMYITDDGVLLGYFGTGEKTVTIPSEVIRIAPYAFYDKTGGTDTVRIKGKEYAVDKSLCNIKKLDQIEKVILPKTVKELAKYSFFGFDPNKVSIEGGGVVPGEAFGKYE